MLLQKLRVKMVMMHVRDIQVRRPCQLRAVNLFIARKREPRGEVGGIEPGIAQNTSISGFNEQANMSEERNLQSRSPSCISMYKPLRIKTCQLWRLYQYYFEIKIMACHPPRTEG